MNNPFLDACGATGPLLLNTESPGVPGGETRAFDLPFVLAGRDPRSDLRLDHTDVSDRHGYFQMVDGQLLCIDLGSRIGIFQGGKCQRLGYLERDRAARIGPYRIRLIGGDRGAGAGTSVSSEAHSPPLPLELDHRSVRRSRCDLPGGLALVGSAADCQIRLIDPSVSNYHCSLVYTPSGVWVVDLLGQGGVRVNGHEVAYAQVHEGDSLQVGHSLIRLLDRSEAVTPAESILPAAPPAFEPITANDYPTPVPTPNPAQTATAAQTAEMVQFALSPMVNQVGLLQQQMMEEFHQARAMLFESFSTLHREQSEFINQELDQIRQLSEELHALRADLERQTLLLNDRLMASPPSSRLGSATNPIPAKIIATQPLNGQGKASQSPPGAGFNRPTREDAVNHGHNHQAHARLCSRIVKLKEKRLSRWEKLLAMFPRSTPGKSST